MPPGPVSVTSLDLVSASRMAAASRDRPKNPEVSAGSLPPCVIKVARPFPEFQTLILSWADVRELPEAGME
jgi:hypothetical protein